MSGNTYWESCVNEFYSKQRDRLVPIKNNDLESIQAEYKQRDRIRRLNRNQQVIQALNARYGVERDKKKKTRSRKGAK